jgi:hypothetical protein
MRARLSKGPLFMMLIVPFLELVVIRRELRNVVGLSAIRVVMTLAMTRGVISATRLMISCFAMVLGMPRVVLMTSTMRGRNRLSNFIDFGNVNNSFPRWGLRI